MKIRVLNTARNLEVNFMSTNDFTRNFIFPGTNAYQNYVNTTGTFRLLTHTGLESGGASVTNTTVKSINQDGSTFYGNSWGENTFTITFEKTTGITWTKLIQVLHYKNNPLYIEITTDQTYYMWCVIDGGDSIEDGEITFVSALPDLGTYWSTGSTLLKHHLLAEGDRWAYVQSGAQTNLGSEHTYQKDDGILKFAYTRFIVGDQYPTYICNEVPSPTGIWFRDETSGISMHYPEDTTGKIIKFDCENQILYVDGTPTTYEGDWIGKLNGGNNEWHFSMDVDSIKDIKYYSWVGMEVEDLYPSVFN